MKKLFVSDVDGTLVSEEFPHFSERLKSAIRLVVENGDQFVLCSGRPTNNLIDISKELTEEGINIEYVAGFNGVEIVDLTKRELIVDNSLTQMDVELILDAVNSLNLNFMIFDESCIRTNIPENYWTIRETKFYGFPSTTEIVACKSQKVLLVVDGDENYQLQNKLKAMIGDSDIFESAPHFIEIVKKGVNKATVIKSLEQIENIDHTNTYGFGDSGNDVELLEYAQTGVVMENGNSKAKAVANVQIGHVDEFAVANYLNEIYTK